MIQEATDSGQLWLVASTIVSAAAAFALAGFAGVHLWKENRRTKHRQFSAHTRISATAFLARRQLRSWLGSGSGSPDAFEEWLLTAQNVGSLSTHLDIAETRFIEMLSLAVDAEPEIMSSVRSAAVHFLSGANRLNTFVDTARPVGIEIADWVQLRNDAWLDFGDCVHILDDKVGVDAWLKEARALDGKRAKENPPVGMLIAKFAHALERLHRDTRD